MALSWLQRVELALFAAAFLCGAVAAAALTRTQLGLQAFWPSTAFCFSSSGCTAVASRIPTGDCPTEDKGLSCSDAQKISWTPPGTAVQFYSNLQNAETSSWVNLVLWCLVWMLQVVQCKSEATQAPERGDPEWSSETAALVGHRPSQS
uniref:transmembrane protein 179B isoform X2 n=1 Tax=Myodes glareolus TaxID=447135 RepID=UPI0020223813|nr:transmembrane protein 179B isoform X2 [Myodes glareolus]